MWQYQWTKKEVELTQELKDALYEESQGIVDIAVKLYAMAQMRAIATGKETITPKIIQQVAKDSLQLVRPMLMALKSGKINEIMKYEDIRPVDVQDFQDQTLQILNLNQVKQRIESSKKANKNNVNTVEEAIIKLLELGVESSVAKQTVESVTKEIGQDVDVTCKDIKIPWGSLPNLVIGQGYKDGLPDESTKTGKVEEIDVSGLNNFKICSGFDMPHNLYYLYKNSLYGRQKVCKFNIKNRTFYVPCIEVIRFFLAPSKTLAYQLLKPQGLDFLIESISYLHKDTVQIDLSRDYPLRLANNDNVMHLLWLMTNKYAKITWNYVLRTLHKKASVIHDVNPTNGFSMGLPIEARPPYMEKSKWTFRGVTSNKDTLIFEIMSIVGLNLKYNFVHYSHPDFYKPIQVSEPKTAKRTENKEGNYNQLDQSQQSARKESNPSTVENAKLRYGFEGLYKIKRSSVIIFTKASYIMVFIIFITIQFNTIYYLPYFSFEVVLLLHLEYRYIHL